MNKITKAIIPIAGKGTRFLPATKGVAKELFPVVDKPVLLLILEECLNSGIKEVLLVITKEKEQDIRQLLSHDSDLEKSLIASGKFGLLKDLNHVIDGLKISYAYQRDDLIGTGGAIYMGKEFANGEDYALLFGDDINYTESGKRPVIGQLIDVYNKYGKMVLGCKQVEYAEVCKYGAVKIKEKLDDRTFLINGVVEKPKTGTQPSNIVSLARYIMPYESFEHLERAMAENPEFLKNRKELCITSHAMDSIMHYEDAYAYLMDSIRYDTGDKLGYLIATVEHGLRHGQVGNQFREYLKNLKL